MSRVTIAVTLLFVVLGGCKPKVGQKCTAGQATCVDAHNALACGSDLVLASVPCKGPKGCTQDRSTKKVECDDSIADEGDACIGYGAENWACSVDHKKALLCDGGTFKLKWQCRGTKGCALNDDPQTMQQTVACDTSLQSKGDPCKRPDSVACSTDGKQMLRCKDGHLDVYRYCRGATGCSIEDNGDFNCDESRAELNDPCGIPGRIVCSMDARSELVCQGGKFVHARDCKKTGCRLTAENRVDCR